MGDPTDPPSATERAVRISRSSVPQARQTLDHTRVQGCQARGRASTPWWPSEPTDLNPPSFPGPSEKIAAGKLPGR